MDETIIDLVDLTKKYGSFTAVDHLSLSINKGEVFGLLGPNGAGKSTTILMMLGMTDPTSGTAHICGIDSTKNPIEVKKRVGYLPEDVGFYGDRSGLDNLIYTARLNNISEKEAKVKARELLKRVGLSEAIEKNAGTYSRGMRQRLGLADVLIKNPEVIILDEPTLGIDPKGIKEFLRLIIQLSKEEGITVLFSSHNLHQVQQVCDRVGLFVNGKLIAVGDIRSLSQRLFADSPYSIDAGINLSASDPKIEKLKEKLSTVEGVTNVNMKDNKFHLECSRDATTEIAKTIIESGFDLNYLNKKEYGLDEIYYRYFEGGDEHE
ncbi:MAG: ABC transporter ATP-binding protein [Bacteroidales bacterium]|nr:ABC transporter ATP-binding protein [Bacteroidales bacterium]